MLRSQIESVKKKQQQQEEIQQLIMANPNANTQLHIPKGLQSLLVGLSMEVLRQQPSNILAFAADYFEKLLKQRGRIRFHFFSLSFRRSSFHMTSVFSHCIPFSMNHRS